MTSIKDLIESAHAAVYTYGVIAAYAEEKQVALNNQAIYRRLRDELIAVVASSDVSAPASAGAYELPLRISNDSSARTVAAELENAICAQWADALAFNKELRNHAFLAIPKQAALRAFSWSGISYAFPN